MKTAIIALCAATLFAAGPVFAQSVSSKAPGHQMRATAKQAHPGAPGYAAGRKMQAKISPFDPRPDIPLVAIKVMNLGDGYQARCPNEPVLQRCNDPGSTLMRGSFPALVRY